MKHLAPPLELEKLTPAQLRECKKPETGVSTETLIALINYAVDCALWHREAEAIDVGRGQKSVRSLDCEFCGFGER